MRQRARTFVSNLVTFAFPFSVHFCGFTCCLGMRKDCRLQNDIRRMIRRVEMVPYWF